MVIFHLLWDLNFFGYIQIDLWSGFWLVLGRMVQTIFIFTTGLTLSISYQAVVHKGKTVSLLSRASHAAKLLGFALVITLLSWLMFQGDLIVFGILHFMGVSVLLSLLFLPLQRWNVLLGIFIMMTSPWVTTITTDLELLSFVGVNNMHSTALDYFPLFPWFGLFLIGVGSYFYLYPKHVSVISWTWLHRLPGYATWCFLGKRSLPVYLVHQPILFGLIWLYATFIQR